MMQQSTQIEKDVTTDKEEGYREQVPSFDKDYQSNVSQDDDECFEEEYEDGSEGEEEEPEEEGPEEGGGDRQWRGNLELGRRGEEAAARYLALHGYDILERNWTCKFGEADIIAQDPDNDALCFIEVKTRRNIDKGIPEEAITKKKQSKYERIALSYLMEADWDEIPVRFDAIGICVNGENRALLRHHKACFNGRW